jgi:4-hydroxy-2-oxoheptanedioate aldolase
MDLPRNAFKHAIAQGKPQLGLWSTLCSRLGAEIIAGAGFDWILLDTEHSPNEVPDLLSQLQALATGTATAVVRPAWNDTVLIKRILDIGALGVLLPYVQNADEARRAVAATRYPPEGVRGVAGSMRASRFGRVKDYHKRAASEICVLVQVETRAALAELDAIAAVPGIDGVFIGPGDLAASLGHIGNPSHPEVQAAIADGLRRLKAKGKPAGILLPNEAEAQRALADGFTFVAVGNDASLLARAADALCNRFRP